MLRVQLSSLVKLFQHYFNRASLSVHIFRKSIGSLHSLAAARCRTKEIGWDRQLPSVRHSAIASGSWRHSSEPTLGQELSPCGKLKLSIKWCSLHVECSWMQLNCIIMCIYTAETLQSKEIRLCSFRHLRSWEGARSKWRALKSTSTPVNPQWKISALQAPVDPSVSEIEANVGPNPQNAAQHWRTWQDSTPMLPVANMSNLSVLPLGLGQEFCKGDQQERATSSRTTLSVSFVHHMNHIRMRERPTRPLDWKGISSGSEEPDPKESSS